ncbi:polysaccharide deacetylase family protein [Streptomyces sp. NPDC004539]|uniref:polysaccharide deacetylase family protein n=1 Tax=Streptomyces sp. NPDC004539 TaxID=3154280 RepID=UPI0033BB7BE1
MRKHTIVPSLLLLGSLALATACSAGSPGTGVRESQAGSGASSSASSEGSGEGPGGSAGAAVTGVEPARIKGLDIVTDSSEHSSCRYATSYPAVPGADAMTASMKQYVTGRLKAFVDAECGSSGGGGAGELNITYQFLVASGDVLGVRLTTLDRASVGDGLATSTYWYDGSAGAARTPLELVSDHARKALIAAVEKQLTGREGIDATQLRTTLAGSADQANVLDDMVFTRDGGLRIDFDRDTVGVAAAGRYTVTLPRTTVTPLLSAFGKRARNQTVSPSGSLDLGARSTPEVTAPAQADPGTDTTDCKQVKCVALTFDDGPAVPETATLLGYLAQYKARATFFTVGQNVTAHPDLVRAEAKAGHEVGNHSWSHPDLTKLTSDQVAYQLSRTSAAIKAATGKEPTLFRPPYGAVNAKVRSATTLSPVLWDIDTEDWKYRDAAKVANTVITKAHRNSVVLLHDIHPTSVAAVPEILRTLTAQGFHFVTVSHLRASIR